MNESGKQRIFSEEERIKYLRQSFKQSIKDHGSNHEHTIFLRDELCKAKVLGLLSKSFVEHAVLN